MNMMLFGPELYYLGMALVFFCFALRRQVQVQLDYRIALAVGHRRPGYRYCLFQQGDLFFKAYRVDLFSQIFSSPWLWTIPGLDDLPHRGPNRGTLPGGILFLPHHYHHRHDDAGELGGTPHIYVALELSSYSLYILVPLRRGDGIDVEAGIKYLFIGAVSSASCSSA